MINLFKLAEKRHDDIQKEAMVGALLNGAKTLGKAVMNNKGKSLAVGLTAMELGAGAKDGARMAARGVNVPTFKVGPQF